MLTDYTRRKFIQTLLSGVALGPAMMCRQKNSNNGIPTRPLGKTGEHISIIGYGGWDIVVDKTEKEAIQMLHEAIDNGITFFDNAWEYHDGLSEDVLGKALKENNSRDKVFLMTKICARDYDGAKRHLADSLSRLRTDYIDLLQFHSIQYADDPQRIFDPEKGGLKALLEAREQGKIRYIGFSGHMYPEKHLEMINKPFEWDSVQMPLNLLDAHFNSFQKKVLPVLQQKNTGVLGMKSLTGQDARLPQELNISVELCRRYALSLPVSTVICGMQTPQELRMHINLARNFKPLDEEQINELLDISREPAKDGHIEAYKNPHGGYGCSYHSRILEEENRG